MPSWKPEKDVATLDDYHFDSQIHKWISINQDLWTVPLSCLIGPCFVVQNRDYVNLDNNDVTEDDSTAYVIEPMNKWGKIFLPHEMANEDEV